MRSLGLLFVFDNDDRAIEVEFTRLEAMAMADMASRIEFAVWSCVCLGTDKFDRALVAFCRIVGRV